MSEEAAFRVACTNLICNMDQLLSSTRYKHGLAIIWEFPPNPLDQNLGYGHLLNMAHALHNVCSELRRFCYVKIADSDLARFFGYANGLSWHVDELELQKYPSSSTIHLTAGSLTNLHRRISKHRGANDKALLRVFVNAHAPSVSYNMTASPRPGQPGYLRPNPCFARYVTEPISELAVEMQKGSSTHVRASYHMRTGFADVMDEELQAHPRQFGETARWVHAAMGTSQLKALQADLFPQNQPVFVMSDSPGLSRYLQQQQPATVQLGCSHKTAHSTRSWNTTLNAKLCALLDLVMSSQSSWIYQGQQRNLLGRSLRTSYFIDPVMKRSVCLVGARAALPMLPRYHDVFLRDMYGVLAATPVRSIRKWSQWRNLSFADVESKTLEKGHPCKHVTRHECNKRFVGALR